MARFLPGKERPITFRRTAKTHSSRKRLRQFCDEALIWANPSPYILFILPGGIDIGCVAPVEPTSRVTSTLP